MFKEWLAVRRKNYELLRRIADQVGRQFEEMPYIVLADPLQPVSYEREIDGIKISWSADVVRTKPNGDIDFSIEFYSDLPTIFGAKPSHRFWKRRDETVYY